MANLGLEKGPTFTNISVLSLFLHVWYARVHVRMCVGTCSRRPRTDTRGLPQSTVYLFFEARSLNMASLASSLPQGSLLMLWPSVGLKVKAPCPSSIYAISGDLQFSLHVSMTNALPRAVPASVYLKVSVLISCHGAPLHHGPETTEP